MVDSSENERLKNDLQSTRKLRSAKMVAKPVEVTTIIPDQVSYLFNIYIRNFSRRLQLRIIIILICIRGYIKCVGIMIVYLL